MSGDWPGLAKVSKGLRGSAGNSRGKRGSAKVCKGMQGSSGTSLDQQGFASVCKGQQGFAGVCKGLQGGQTQDFSWTDPKLLFDRPTPALGQTPNCSWTEPNFSWTDPRLLLDRLQGFAIAQGHLVAHVRRHKNAGILSFFDIRRGLRVVI